MKMENKRLIVLVLCLSVLLCLMPASAIATDLVADETVSLVGAEVVSLREENVKHFDMGDGTYQAIAYSHPVHKLDSEGNWQNIDFSMKQTQTRGVRGYTNSAGTTLAANYTENQPLVTMNSDGTSIAMTLLPNKNETVASMRAAKETTTVTAKFTETPTQIKTFSDAQEVSFSNTLYYESVMPGVDLEYVVDPWTVKENIIVSKPASQYTYQFKLEMTGLYPVLQEDGSVLIYNNATKAVEYEIPAPYMYDATGEMSFDVSYTVTGSNGIYFLTITADEDWINDGRSFPIVIDPSVNTTANVFRDTYITGDLPNEARGSLGFLFVGQNEVAFLGVPIPTLPRYASLNWAALSIYYFYKTSVKSGYVDVTAHKVTGLDWSESTLTWNNVMAIDPINYGLSTNALHNSEENNYGVVRLSAEEGAYPSCPKLTAFLVTDAIKEWQNNPGQSNGIGLKYQNSSSNRSIMFRFTEGSVSYRPHLTYQYFLPYSPNNLKEVDLIVQYDGEYHNRCYEEPAEYIMREMFKLQEFFLSEFDIMVNCNTPQLFSSYPDKHCSAIYSAGCGCEDTFCTNANSDSNHHTNIYQILYDIIQENQDGIIMSYIGWKTCRFDGTGCADSLLKGVAFPEHRVIAITNNWGEDSETVTAIHEMGHMVGIEDHYDDVTGDNDGTMSLTEVSKVYGDLTYSDSCLYGINGFGENDPDKIVICQGCRNRVNEWRNANSG